MKRKTWALLTCAMLILAIAGASLLVIFVDPFQVYRLATLYMPPIDNTTQVYANAGIARNYDCDVVDRLYNTIGGSRCVSVRSAGHISQ